LLCEEEEGSHEVMGGVGFELNIGEFSNGMRGIRVWGHLGCSG